MISYYHKKKGQQIEKLTGPAKGCWINIYPPFNQDELKILSNKLDVPLDYFIDSLDIDERSRYEAEDGVQFIVINIPVKNINEEEHEADYITIPIGIIEVDDYFITVSAFENEVLDFFLHKNPKPFDSNKHSEFVLLIFDKVVFYFIHYLKLINNKRNLYERELYDSSRNEELARLMNLQKSLVYFVTTLRDNEMMMLRIQRTNFLKVKGDEELEDLFDDILIDTSQAQDMAQIYTSILNGTMDAFASIISNNMNTIMKRLTSITIILMVPTLVASFYGMNVSVPGGGYPHSFKLILLLSIVLSFLLAWFMMRKRFF